MFHVKQINYKGEKNMLLLIIDILLYYITNWKLFYWFGWFIVVGWLSALAFTLGMYLSIIINLI